MFFLFYTLPLFFYFYRMDICGELIKEHSKPQALRIAAYIGADEDRFAELMQLFFSKDYRITQRASWPMNFCVEKYPFLLLPYLPQMIENLKRDDVHDAVKRNSVRVLQFFDIPDELLGEVADVCFHLLSAAHSPIAVKAFCMPILLHICRKEPDLKNELKMLIEEQMPYAAPAFISSGQRVLKQLENIR
jgi:hypothetical protein